MVAIMADRRGRGQQDAPAEGQNTGGRGGYGELSQLRKATGTAVIPNARAGKRSELIPWIDHAMSEGNLGEPQMLTVPQVDGVTGEAVLDEAGQPVYVEREFTGAEAKAFKAELETAARQRKLLDNGYALRVTADVSTPLKEVPADKTGIHVQFLVKRRPERAAG
jgi:hypothetical protein